MSTSPITAGHLFAGFSQLPDQLSRDSAKPGGRPAMSNTTNNSQPDPTMAACRDLLARALDAGISAGELEMLIRAEVRRSRRGAQTEPCSHAPGPLSPEAIAQGLGR